MNAFFVTVFLAISGVVGALMSSLMLTASFLLGTGDVYYDLSAIGISITALIGSIMIIVFAVRLNAERTKKTELTCLALAAVFAGLSYLLSSLPNAMCSGLFALSCIFCLFYKDKVEVKAEEPDCPS